LLGRPQPLLGGRIEQQVLAVFDECGVFYTDLP
jgi:hypothetical protein